MQLRLVRNVATVVTIRKATDEESKNEDCSIQYRLLFKEDDLRTFAVEFHVEMTLDESTFLEVRYLCAFETDDDFNESFKESHFARVNAPAIAFPFIRSYIAHLTLIAGYEPVILASMNFTVPPAALLPVTESQLPGKD